MSANMQEKAAEAVDKLKAGDKLLKSGFHCSSMKNRF